MDMNSHDQTPAGRIHGMIKSCATEDPLGSKHLKPGRYISERNPAEIGHSQHSFPSLEQGRYANNPINKGKHFGVCSAGCQGSTLSIAGGLQSSAVISNPFCSSEIK